MGELSDEQIERYARQLVLPEIGGLGQIRLLQARVLIVGAGGLGCPLALYLAGAGIGSIRIVDDDQIDKGNLHRQIAYSAANIGQAKVQALRDRLATLNPDCQVEACEVRLCADNVDELLADIGIIADGSDNLQTRKLVHDAAMRHGKALVSAAVQAFDGQLTVFRAFMGEGHPCMHCLHPGDTDESLLPSCAGGGVLGPVAAVMAGMQGVEVVKLALGGEPSLDGQLLVYDARHQESMTISLGKNPQCRFCQSLPKT